MPQFATPSQDAENLWSRWDHCTRRTRTSQNRRPPLRRTDRPAPPQTFSKCTKVPVGARRSGGNSNSAARSGTGETIVVLGCGFTTTSGSCCLRYPIRRTKLARPPFAIIRPTSVGGNPKPRDQGDTGSPTTLTKRLEAGDPGSCSVARHAAST